MCLWLHTSFSQTQLGMASLFIAADPRLSALHGHIKAALLTEKSGNNLSGKNHPLRSKWTFTP